MSHTYEVDQFASSKAFDEFKLRCQQVVRTILGLNLGGRGEKEYPAVIFGSASAILQAVDMHIPGKYIPSVPSVKGLDVDAVVCWPMLRRVGNEFGFKGPWRETDGIFQAQTVPTTERPLPVDLLARKVPGRFTRILGNELYLGVATSGMVDMTDTIGVNLVEADQVALAKVVDVEGPNVKGLSSVIKGNVFGVHFGSVAVTSPFWKAAVALAMEGVTEAMSAPQEVRPEFPSWVTELALREFDHPAFANIERSQI